MTTVNNPRISGGTVAYPQGHPGTSTTVGHLTDANTGNVYPVVIKSARVQNTTPPMILPGTAPIAQSPPTPGSCAVCDAVSPFVPLLLVAGVVVVILYLATRG